MTQEEKSLAAVTPAMGLTDFKGDVIGMMALVKEQMRENQDFGIIPYTKKKTLFDPGAEKLAKFFGLVPKYILVNKIEDWDKSFVYYKYKCELYHFKSGKFAGDAERSCNSRETKWRTKLVYDVANTVEAMAQKRAFVEAVKTETMASEIFADTAVKEEAPGRPMTKEEDPVRVGLMSALFTAAKDRGFSQQNVKDNLYRKYKVDSLTKVSDKQLQESTESLITKFRVVPLGSKPEQFPVKDEAVVEGEEVTLPTGSKIEEAEVVKESFTPLDPQKDSKKKDSIKGSDLVSEKDLEDEERECYNKCGKMITQKIAYNDVFCSKKCNEEWYNRTYPNKKSRQKFEELVNKGRAAAK